LLVETTTVRTKNALTIVSQHPTRHVQIVLRLYSSIDEILIGFDVDCSCAAYDGHQVYATPRALAAYMTQINTIDLTRRSPSYESRLSKYARRGFEIYWPHLDRSRIDPTIFERSFGRTEGLSRLLVLEKLPKSEDRDAYTDQRRAERGRPAINRLRMQRRHFSGNIKDEHEEEIAEWMDTEDVSDYHTFTIPYGPKYNARKIEKLVYKNDMLLNAEWNVPKDRTVHLHRHPAFFGRAEDVFSDCCGCCPEPTTIEEEEVAVTENKIYVSGKISFLKDDPGRQMIGSFHPLTDNDWTKMAYVGNTARLCQSIVEGDVEYVRTWLEQPGNDPNTRDYTGRTPLHLAVMSSTPEIVEVLIDHGARLVARLVDGRTALHLAAIRGNVEMVAALLRKSAVNEEEQQKKLDLKRAARAKQLTHKDDDSDVDQLDDFDGDERSIIDATTEGSMIDIKSLNINADDKAPDGDDENDPDVYDVNVLAWDTAISPLHLAIINGHLDLVQVLVQEFGADVLVPVKLFNDHDKSARAAILTLVLSLRLPLKQADAMARLLIDLGASCAQADINQHTALLYAVVEEPAIAKVFLEADQTGAFRAINHLAYSSFGLGVQLRYPLMAAIEVKDSDSALLLLTAGAKPEITFAAYMKALKATIEPSPNTQTNQAKFRRDVEQPVISAVESELPHLAMTLVEEYGADVNTITAASWAFMNPEQHIYYIRDTKPASLLDAVNQKIQNLRTQPQVEKIPNAPVPLEEDSKYLEGLQEGSYALWTARSQLEQAKIDYKADLNSYEKEVAEKTDDNAGIAEKLRGISTMVEGYGALKATLIQRGAKTFRELHPDVQVGRTQPQRPYERRKYVKPIFKVNFHPKLPDLTDERQEKYMQLFEAAWTGDMRAVKQLTLTPWKNQEGDTEAPLKVAVQDQRQHSPFSIAAVRGHMNLATTIMDIAQAQYMPPDEPAKRRYVLGRDGDSDDQSIDSDTDAESFELSSQLADPDFTIDTIGEVSVQVKSRVKPITMLLWQSCDLKEFLPEPTNRTVANQKLLCNGPISFALHSANKDLLDHLVTLGEKFCGLFDPDETSADFYDLLEPHFQEAMRLDNPQLLAHLIERTAIGIPSRRLIKDSGVQVNEKAKYYPGLSVNGRKRRDWAARPGQYRRNYGVGAVDSDVTPLLQAIYYASIQCVEWLLSDTPMRLYSQHAQDHSQDKRVRLLSQTDRGFEGSVQDFLTARMHLSIHCAVLARPTAESAVVLRYLLKVMPDIIDVKSEDGLTPLLIAFRLYRHEAASILIQAGADQTIRDAEGRNLIHSLLMQSFNSDRHVKELRTMLDLIDHRLLADFFLERSSETPGALTPLAQFIKATSHLTNKWSEHNNKALRVILAYSKGTELSVINGEGHTPLHVAVRNKDPSLTQIILEHDPILLLREGSTGRTPFEMAQDADIAAAVQDVPMLPVRSRYRVHRSRPTPPSIIEREAKTFVPGYVAETESDQEAVWRLLKEARSQLDTSGVAKRRLVTLNEANEVAKRLAAMKKTSPARPHASQYGTHEQGEEHGDEVRRWLRPASIVVEEDDVE
jgi:ankyrin repeat protein